PAALHQILDAEDLGRGRAAEGHALSLSQPAQSSDPVDRRRPLAAQDRRADFHPGRDDKDDHPPHAGGGDGKDDRLGRRRAGGLHAYLDYYQPRTGGQHSMRDGSQPTASSAPSAHWEDAMKRYVSMSIRLSALVLLAALIGAATQAQAE